MIPIWALILSDNLRAAAREEMRVRAAYARVMKEWGYVLREARMRVPTGGRR